MKRLFSLLLVLISLAAQAQDKIYVRTQRQPIEGIITEVGDREIKYHMPDRPLPVLTVDKMDVIRIEFASGQKLQLADPSKDFNLYYDQHLWNAKVNLFSPLHGHTQLFLENVVKPGRSREFELNIIGLGVDPNMLDGSYNSAANEAYTYKAQGIGVGYGVRFIRMPDYMGTSTRLRHLMQGSYVKPAISAAYYTRNFVVQQNSMTPPYTSNTYVERKPVFAVSGTISAGRQWILDNMISIDLYVLAGIGYDNVRSTQEKIVDDANGVLPGSFTDYAPYRAFGATRFGKSDLGMLLGTGIRVGFLFDWKKETKTKIK